MDLAPTLGVFTQPGTASIYNFLVVKVKNSILSNLLGMMEYIKWNMVLFADTVKILRGVKKKGVIVYYFSPIYLFLSCLFVTHPQSDSSTRAVL